MPHQTFGAVRLTASREPITFDFGVYGEETFTIIPEPSLGDCFELYDTPDPTPENELEAVRAIARFIERMLEPNDRQRFREALKRIPVSESHVVIKCGEWITEQVTGFPMNPPEDSSSGRVNTGSRSKSKSGGTRHSKR